MQVSRSHRLPRGALAASAMLAWLVGCPTEGEPVDDDDATSPGLGDPGCILTVTNELTQAVTSLTTSEDSFQFESVELLDAPLMPGETRDLDVSPQGHFLVGLDEAGGWYEVGSLLCVWDESLAVAVQADDLRVPGLKLENGTSEPIVSLLVSPVGTLAWSANLLDEELPPFSNRVMPLGLGRWYGLARNAQGTGYMANFELFAQPPQVELGISRMFVLPGEPCVWTIHNDSVSDLVRVTFSEQSTGAFLALGLPESEMVPTGESVEGILAPGMWDLEVRFADGGAANDTGFLCVDGETYLFEASP